MVFGTKRALLVTMLVAPLALFGCGSTSNDSQGGSGGQATGGATGTGGALHTGGATGTGGATSTGGANGTTASGGSPASTGGASTGGAGTGGAATGGAATGGEVMGTGGKAAGGGGAGGKASGGAGGKAGGTGGKGGASGAGQGLMQACTAACAMQKGLACFTDAAMCLTKCLGEPALTKSNLNGSTDCLAEFTAMLQCEAALAGSKWVCSSDENVPIPAQGQCQATVCAWTCCATDLVAPTDQWSFCDGANKC